MKNALVLGGTVPHAQLIERLKMRGYKTILIDYTSNPPAKSYADFHIKESSLDMETVAKIAEEEGASLVISTCIDQANSTACFVGERLGLPIPYSYETSLNVTRKGRMKIIFKANGIPTSDFYIIDRNDSRTLQLDLPLVTKPTDANSSRGVFKVETEEEFYRRVEESFGFSREGKVIVEKFISGTEIQVDCMAIDGVAHILMTRDKDTMQISGRELQVSGFSIPGRVCSLYMDELEVIAQKIVSAFGLKNTPFFYQAICNEEGVFVLEFAPRIAGGTTYEMVQMYTGVDYLDTAIRSFLQEDIRVNICKADCVYVSRFLYMKPGVYSHIQGLKEVLMDHLIDYYFPFGVSGKIIEDSLSSGNRIGAVSVRANSYEEAQEKIAMAMAKLSVIDSQSRDLSFWK